MTAYYNEIEPYAAEWLRNLIAAGHIAPGVVDTRSIEDVHPADLKDFTQCHFFAGIGVWSLALRRAGWPDDRPVWTGSCPCQPFSAAGQGAGFADERHLWPTFHHLIRQRRPAVVIGEQVASKDADPWIDLVQDDMEGVGYRFGAIPFPSAGVGAPHIRDRLYWVADASGARQLSSAQRSVHRGQKSAGARDGEPQRPGAAGGLADPDCSTGRQGRADVRRWTDGGDAQSRSGSGGSIVPRRLADANGWHAGAERQQRSGEQRQQLQDGGRGGLAPGGLDNTIGDGRPEGRNTDRGDVGQQPTATGQLQSAGPGPTNGYWRAADWLGCRDGKWRPVEPGTFPLAHGATSRVGRLRAYGNAINAEAARVFIEAVMEAA